MFMLTTYLHWKIYQMFYFYNQLLLFPLFEVVWFALAIISHKKIINPTIVFNTENFC